MGSTDSLNTLMVALAERDEILRTVNIEGAKAFIVKHGAKLPRVADWERVIHIARLEVTSLPQGLRDESLVYLARTGARSLSRGTRLSPKSPYAIAAMNLIFPKTLTDALVRQIGAINE